MAGGGGGMRARLRGEREFRLKKQCIFKDFGFASVRGHHNESNTKRVYVNRDIIRQ